MASKLRAPPKTRRRSKAEPPRAIVVRSLDQATTALRIAAELDVPVELWSAEGAAAYAGAGWFMAVVDAARAAVPAAQAQAVLDCAALPGYALGAFRIGIEAVCFTGPAKVATKLDDIAQQLGRRLLRHRPPRALDLRHLEDATAACRSWLGEGRLP